MADGDARKGMKAARGRDFQDRVTYYAVKAATAIVGEVGTTPGHSERKVYADSVLAGTADMAQLSIAVATNSTVVSNISDSGGHSAVPDSDIEFTVNSLVDDFAGYEAP